MRELARSDPVRPRDRWSRKLDVIVWPRRGIFGRSWYRRRGFDPSEPRDEQGRWTEGGGGGEQGELWPGKFPGKKGGKAKLEDFGKDKIEVNTTKPEKFIEAWNDAIGLDPGEFHEKFTGGLKSTMEISHAYNEHSDGDVMTNRIQINGSLQDENGRSIGTYTRVIDLKNNDAESSYFKMSSSEQGKGEGKTLLAANVKMYQELGLDKVEVHANIDVGGYAWAKYGYVPTQDSWDDLRSTLRDKLDGSGGTTSYTPEEWDSMSGDNQDSVFEHWKENTHDEFEQSEIDNWHESGRALDDAKTAVAEQFNAESQWANNAIDKWRSERPADAPEMLSNKRILDIITVEYDSRHGDGTDDPTITIEDVEWLTEHDLNTLEAALIESFNGRAEDKANEMDPPNLDDSIADIQSEVWSGMRDRDKFSYAEDHGLIEDIEDEGSGDYEGPAVNVSESERDDLQALLDEEDPKSIWAVADSPGGKELLLGSDWNGAIDLKDKDTMTRFNAYVGGRKKPSAAAAA